MEIRELARRLRVELVDKCGPDEKMPSERKLASRFHTTQNRVHRAIQTLVAEGALQTKAKSGTYVSGAVPSSPSSGEFDDHPLVAPRLLGMGANVGIRVCVPVGGSDEQKRFWMSVFEAFHEERPYVEIIPVFCHGQETVETQDHDVAVLIDQSLTVCRDAYEPLDWKLLASLGGAPEEEMSDGVLAPFRHGGRLYGVPLLRMTSSLWVNRKLLKSNGVSIADLKRPVDVFRVGRQIETSSDGELLGTNYRRYHWHASHYGFWIECENGRLRMDWKLLRRFLEEFRPCILKRHLRSDGDGGRKAFFEGRMAAFSDYLSFQPLAERSQAPLEMIGLPLEPGGFVNEVTCAGAVRKGCANMDIACELLAFLTTRKAQETMAGLAPNWLSTRKDVLAEQRSSSPFPDGSVVYDHDLRMYYTDSNDYIFKRFGPMINTQSAKYFLGLQDLDSTIENLRKHEAEVRT